MGSWIAAVETRTTICSVKATHTCQTGTGRGLNRTSRAVNSVPSSAGATRNASTRGPMNP